MCDVQLFKKMLVDFFFPELDIFSGNVGSLSFPNPVSQSQTEGSIFLRQLFKTAASLIASTELNSYKQIGQEVINLFELTDY